MRRCRLLLALGLLLPIALGAATPPPAGDIAFVGAHVLPMTGPYTLDDHTVIVRDGLVVAVGPSARIEPAPTDRIIDATGLTLMPGLAEMHAHVPLPSADGMPEGYREDVLTLWVANGITLARGMLGHASHLALREDLDAHRVLGPRLITSGPSFNGDTVRSPAAARARVADQVEAGYDFLKLHPGLTRETFDAIAAAAAEADMPFGGHVSADVGLRRTLAGGQGTIDHLDGYLRALVEDGEGAEDVPDGAADFFGLGLAPFVDRDRLPELVRATRDAGAAVVPTHTLLDNVAGASVDLAALEARPENAWLPPALRQAYLRRLRAGADPAFDAEAYLALRDELLLALHRGGVPVLLGSDSPQIMNVPGFSIHRELESYVDAGLHPMEALATGTANVGRFLETEQLGRSALGAAGIGGPPRVGTIAEGAEGSLVLLRGNPIVDIRRTREIEGVLLRGSFLDRAFLDAALEDIRRRYETR